MAVALGAPATSQAVTTYTRSASCAGLDFYPADSRTEYDNYGPLRVCVTPTNGLYGADVIYTISSTRG